MNELAELTIKAHGGLKRWGKFETVSAHLVQGGALWALKGQAGTLDDTNFTVGIRSEWARRPLGRAFALGGEWKNLATPKGQLSRRYRHAQCL
jgi:hypothetical protein